MAVVGERERDETHEMKPSSLDDSPAAGEAHHACVESLACHVESPVHHVELSGVSSMSPRIKVSVNDFAISIAAPSGAGACWMMEAT